MSKPKTTDPWSLSVGAPLHIAADSMFKPATSEQVAEKVRSAIEKVPGVRSVTSVKAGAAKGKFTATFAVQGIGEWISMVIGGEQHAINRKVGMSLRNHGLPAWSEEATVWNVTDVNGNTKSRPRRWVTEEWLHVLLDTDGFMRNSRGHPGKVALRPPTWWIERAAANKDALAAAFAMGGGKAMWKLWDHLNVRNLGAGLDGA